MLSRLVFGCFFVCPCWVVVQSHAALREGHRLQNRELLREQIEPLAHMLNEDSRYGEFTSVFLVRLQLFVSLFACGRWWCGLVLWGSFVAGGVVTQHRRLTLFG